MQHTFNFEEGIKNGQKADENVYCVFQLLQNALNSFTLLTNG